MTAKTVNEWSGRVGSSFCSAYIGSLMLKLDAILYVVSIVVIIFNSNENSLA